MLGLGLSLKQSAGVVPGVPSAPTIGTCSGLSSTEAEVVFVESARGPVSYYEVDVYDELNSLVFAFTSVVTGTSSPIIINDLTAAGSWSFRVRAVNARGSSLASGYSNVIGTDPAPDPE